MLIELAINCDPVEVGQYSECQALVKALDYYKNSVGLDSNDSTLLYALDSLQHKLTLSFVIAVEGLDSRAKETPLV